MTAVSDGSSSLRPLVDAAISASCEALAAAEEAEQVREEKTEKKLDLLARPIGFDFLDFFRSVSAAEPLDLSPSLCF